VFDQQRGELLDWRVREPRCRSVDRLIHVVAIDRVALVVDQIVLERLLAMTRVFPAA
jgi:hypothetical protein